MPGVRASLLQASEDDAGGDLEPVESTPLLFPSRLAPENRHWTCLHRVAEHEQLLRMAQLQDSLIELRHTRKIRHKLLLNHHVQIAGQGQRASTRSRAVLESVEDRIAKYVERYRLAYRALLQLDPTGDWRKTYKELRDCDNRGPGKERDEERASNGKYFRSWIWLPNPQVALSAKARPVDGTEGDVGKGGSRGDGGEARVGGVDLDDEAVGGPTNDEAGRASANDEAVATAGRASANDSDDAEIGTANNKAEVNIAMEEEVDDDAEVETATQEEVNEVIRVEWTTSYARLARWTEEVELLHEEMRRVVAFLEWKSVDWLARADGRGENPTLDIRSGLNAYAQKQAAVYHDLAVSFAKFWYPTLESYGLECSWVVDYMNSHSLPLPNTDIPLSRERGIFKFRIPDKSRKTITPAAPSPSQSLAVATTPAAPSPSQSTAVATTPANHPLLAVATTPTNHPLLAVAATPINHLPLDEATHGDSDSGSESDYDSETDWDDDDY